MGAIDYAEVTLGVHSVYANTLAARKQFDELQKEAAKLRVERRRAEEAVEDYEMDLSTTERGTRPSMSATAFKEHMKGKLHANDLFRELKKKVADLDQRLDLLGDDMRVLDKDIRIGCSRMEQLGGYLQYLAAVKSAAMKP